jgi:hypothetical protein
MPDAIPPAPPAAAVGAVHGATGPAVKRDAAGRRADVAVAKARRAADRTASEAGAAPAEFGFRSATTP